MPASKHTPNAFEAEVRGRKLAVKVDPRQRERMLGKDQWNEHRWRGQFAGCFAIGRFPEDVLREFQTQIVKCIEEVIDHEYVGETITIELEDTRRVGWPDFMPATHCDAPTTDFAPTGRWHGKIIVPGPGYKVIPTNQLSISLAIYQKPWGYLAMIDTMYPGPKIGDLSGEVTNWVFVPRTVRATTLEDLLAAE